MAAKSQNISTATTGIGQTQYATQSGNSHQHSGPGIGYAPILPLQSCNLNFNVVAEEDSSKINGVTLPSSIIENDQIFILPMNSGYLIIKGNKQISGGREYHSFTKFEEVVKWLKENPVLTRDESLIAENI